MIVLEGGVKKKKRSLKKNHCLEKRKERPLASPKLEKK